MTRLDLPDIQGNIHRPYGRFGFPHARHFFFNISDSAAGRNFVQGIRQRITTAEPWKEIAGADGKPLAEKPPITLNIGFTYLGLVALDLPTRTLRLFPDEFIDGMRCRAEILGDVEGSAPDKWNSIWDYGIRDRAKQVHVWVSFNVGANPDGSAKDIREDWTDWICSLARNGVSLLTGHGANEKSLWQDSAAIMEQHDGVMIAQPTEHFGFTDGISDPVFKGQLDQKAEQLAVIGGGKIAEGAYSDNKSWSAIETGEFILGHVDEGQEFPVATQPAGFARNGTFMVWRKLRQDVQAFDHEVKRQADIWKLQNGITDDHEAMETLCAKMVGRWKSGIPLAVAPDWVTHQKMMHDWADCFSQTLRRSREAIAQDRLARFALMLTGFRYGGDLDGSKCPFGAHIRRANPRDMLDPKLSGSEGSSTLTNRRRLLRRGLPYKDGEEKGVIFMGICSSLFRQFEFIQQQWMNYGMDFDAGNDSCPLIGNRSQSSKHVIPAGAANDTPFIAAGLPEFVSTRGGDYFFLPSLTAIRMIAMGTVDPT